VADATKRKQIIWVYVALAVITFAAYCQVLEFGLTHYDDDEYVGKNPIVQQGLTMRGLKWALTTTQFSYVHPLTCLSHMLDCQLSGMNIGAHHLTSLLLHIANSLLVLAVILRMTGALWRSAFVAALFALHPLHVESVVWIAERKDVLSTFFWLLTIFAYLRHVERPSPALYFMTLLAFACGLMSKPMVVTLPCVLLLMDYWPLQRLRIFRIADRGDGVPLRRLLMDKLPFAALAGIACVITVVAMRSVGHIGSREVVPWALRLTNVPISNVRYLLKMIWPDPLAVLYPMPAHWPLWQVISSSIMLLVISVAVLAQARRRPYLLFGWTWFLGTLLPAIGLIPVAWHSMADRYTYIPSIGLFVMVTWGAADLLPRWVASKAAVAATAVLILAGCDAKTWAPTQHWRNVKTLFANAVAVTQDNPIAQYNLGVALLAENNTPGAMECFRAAVRLKPNYDSAHNNLGRLLHLQGDPAAAVEHLREAIRINPALDTAHFNLGLALRALGRDNEAVTHLAAAVRIAPVYPELHAELGAVLMSEGRIQDAVNVYRRALRPCPNSPLLLNNLAWLLSSNPDPAIRNGVEAVGLAERACRLTNHEQPIFLGTLAAAYAETGQFDEATATAKMARDLARAKGMDGVAARNEELLKLYQNGRPFHEPEARPSPVK
jgi:protein O-mannosyl-transferase